MYRIRTLLFLSNLLLVCSLGVAPHLLIGQSLAGMQINGLLREESGLKVSANFSAPLPSDWFPQTSTASGLFPPRRSFEQAARNGKVTYLPLSRAFNLNMQQPVQTVVSSVKLLDAIYINDLIHDDPTSSSSYFDDLPGQAASAKVAPKQEMQAAMLHLRRESSNGHGDLWLFGGLAAWAQDGLAHVDLVVQRKKEASTLWRFGELGEVSQAGDMTITIDRTSHWNQYTIRTWLLMTAEEAGVNFPAGLNARQVLPFQFTGNRIKGEEMDQYFVEIIPRTQQRAFYMRANARATVGPNWGVWRQGESTPHADYLPYQFQEFGCNLSVLGLDPNRYLGPCQSLFGWVQVKVRASQALFTGPIDFTTSVALGDFVERKIQVSIPPLTCDRDAVRPVVQFNDLPQVWSWENMKGFRAFSPEPELTRAGDYFIRVSSGQGCFIADTIPLTRDFRTPEVVVEGGNINCRRSQVLLTASDLERPTTSYWFDPGDSTFVQANAHLVDTTGLYTVKLKDLINGCSAIYTHEVVADTIRPALALTDYHLDCNQPNVRAVPTVNPQDSLSFLWRGPVGFASQAKTPDLFMAGSHQLTITDETNGCRKVDSLIVTTDFGNISATLAADTLSCTKPQVQILATVANDSAFTFNWTGPNGFSSDSLSPWVSDSGQYVLEIVAERTGCTVRHPINIKDLRIPFSFSFEAAMINCYQDSIRLDGQPIQAGNYAYRWEGPQGRIDSTRRFVARETGRYELQVVDLQSGCLEDSFVQVISDLTKPPIALSKSGDLTCTFPKSFLFPGVSGGEYRFNWAGPEGFRSGLGTIQVVDSGWYTLTATNQRNGCTQTDSIQLHQDQRIPVATIGQPGTVSCFSQLSELSLSVDDSTRYQFIWSGPQGFSSEEREPTAPYRGAYSVTVIDPVNGCTTERETFINGYNTPPAFHVSDGLLGCKDDSLRLSLTLLEPRNVEYDWIGPGGFQSNEQQPWVDEPGIYSVEVVEGGTGCAKDTFLTIVENRSIPFVEVWADALGCEGSTSEMTLQFSIGGDYRFEWTGPHQFSSTQPTFTVEEPGTYVLVMTDIETECSAVDSVRVARNTTPPTLSLSKTGDLSSTVRQVTLLAFTNGQNAIYDWRGANGFHSSDAFPVVTDSGMYTLTLTDGNRLCQSVDSIQVIQRPNRLSQKRAADLRLMPNPAKEIVEVSFQMPGPGRMDIEVFDTKGQVWLEAVGKQFVSGELRSTERLGIADLPAGVYVVMLSWNGNLVDRKQLIKIE